MAKNFKIIKHQNNRCLHLKLQGGGKRKHTENKDHRVLGIGLGYLVCWKYIEEIHEHTHQEEHPWMEVIILTGHGTIDSAAECTRRGAYSYLQKPCGLEQILECLIAAYKKRVMNKTRLDEKRMDELLKLSLSASPRGILQKLKEMERAFY